MMETPRIRYRVNVNRLAKGNFSFDCTCELDAPVELINGDSPSHVAMSKIREAVLEESDKLVQLLSEKYPVEVA